MANWEQSDRERAYTSLCEAVTAAGKPHETMFLARLALLLGEELADVDAFARCISAAAFPDAAK
jgi:hypothetical protein